ncbi:MAG: TRAP transporter large permease subunit [Candidatus Krumholzibacteria bacterium]|nr:TRAP transporter large permease subunit [Candidatus Krumholzibacteria bacterium]MDH4337823.1 TRAP transporter large permease subunit [Candidatus Krumholzibacteria bacterium]MDH5270084.1 TRAP transporter large permease subunit [Candidatus Krumholzibacteria bacterium]
MLVVLIIALVLLALFGMPLFAVFGVLALFLFHAAGIDISSVAVSMYSIAGSPLLVAIPLFTLAGYLFAHSHAPDRLVRLSRAFFPGGLAVVALVACAVFTAFTGASGVTIVAMGGLLMPALLADRYSNRFSLGLITASGSIGLLFPPSLPLIVYGYVAEVEVDKLFLAGILPGLLLVSLLVLYSVRQGRREGVRTQRFSLHEAAAAVRDAAWELPLPFIVLGGIYGGIFTVMEAAAVTALYALIVEVLIYRDISLRRLPAIIAESATLVGGILIIIMCSFGFVNYLIDAEVPMNILSWMQQYVTSKYTFLLILNVFLLVVGCLMDIFSALIVVVPLVAPVAVGFGVDPVHLGIIFLTNLEIGYLTPPVGLNLFISSYRFQQPVVKLYGASIPFLLLMLVALLIITYAPALSLVLVNLFAG